LEFPQITISKKILDLVNNSSELTTNLAAAAHLIQASSEGRFKITYCPGHLSEQEIRSVNFQYNDLSEALNKYPPDTLKEGFNTMDSGEEIFFISNPALGLWACRNKLKD